MYSTPYANYVRKEFLLPNISAGESTMFNGIYIDACATRSSVMSHAQYKA